MRPAVEPGAPASLLAVTRTFTFALFAVVILRHAWVSDDAYITLRTIDNFLDGLGLRWNAAERVQSYTHPLWMMGLTVVYYLTRETFYTTILLSAGVSLAAAWLIAHRHARNPVAGTLALVALGSSLAFVDYSTSGLENPLSHLLLGGFFLLYLGGDRSSRGLRRLTLLASGVALTRLDLTLVVLPALAEIYWETRARRPWREALAGLAPLLAWELFSLVYYGFLFPNTAYAKLGAGLGMTDLLGQGGLYFITTLDLDPMTIFVLLAGVTLPLLRRDRRELAVVGGLVLYLLYILRIGGDFMLGRFLSAPVYVAVLLVVRQRFIPATVAGLAPAALLFAIGGYIQYPTLRADGAYKKERGRPLKDDRGIADERAFYHDTNSLLTASREPPPPQGADWAQDGLRAAKFPQKVVVFWATGMAGFFAGSQKHVIDMYALTDPLLARLPAAGNPEWRIGHAMRTLPDGYIETLETGSNRLVDPKLASYYEDLALVVRGPILSASRFAAIWRLNTGMDDDLIDVEKYRRQRYREIPIGRLRIGDVVRPEPLGESPSGIWVKLDSPTREATVTVRVESNDSYRVAFTKGWQETGSVTLPKSTARSPMVDQEIDVPRVPQLDGYDGLRIVAVEGDGKYSLGGVKIGGR